MPFAAVWGRNFSQLYLGFASLLATLAGVYLLSKRLKFSTVDAYWLALFFCFSTVFLGTAILGFTSYLVQAVGVALIFLALAEFFGQRRYFLIGILLAAAGLTRISLFLSLLFFALVSLQEKRPLTKLVWLGIPILMSLVILGAYNYKRFRSPFESGYRYQSTALSYPMSKNILPGLFSPYHLPTNLYALLVQAPDPVLDPRGGFMLTFPFLKANPWGMAIWFTSPLFIFLINLRRGKYFWAILATTVALALPSLFYFGIGYSQFGYRYSLDFLPFLFLLLTFALGNKLLWRHKLAIIIGILFNLFYLGSLFGAYPFFNFYE